MKKEFIDLEGRKHICYTVKNVVIGSGCAAYNAADWLFDLGEKDTVIITDGITRGTSRNAGSDKQTYYKLSLCGSEGDSVGEMARTLFNGKGVNGDNALCEAACSVKCFMKLANLGVRFPTNRYGEYVGYQTDNDPRCRGTSAGPYTSKDMTEALEKSVKSKGITILDNMMAVKISVDRGRVTGIVALDTAEKTNVKNPFSMLKLFKCENIIMATGGPSGVYSNSVYPKTQSGMTGMAIDAGAKCVNLSEWQYGLASVDYRWNVSGTYQQVLPAYLSVDDDGTVREFLADYIDSDKVLLYQFLKGYQWPFASSHVPGSSQVDIAVSEELKKGRRVYLDFNHNPREFTSVENLPPEARDYLMKSGATQSTPIERLKFMNYSAYSLYAEKGIDLESDLLKIAVCAQHLNGGIAVNSNWESDIPGLYVCGEAAGTFGVSRPGGAALNSAQVGSMRAAEHIAYKSVKKQEGTYSLLSAARETVKQINSLQSGDPEKLEAARVIPDLMSTYGAHIRDLYEIEKIMDSAWKILNNFFTSCGVRDFTEIPDAFRTYDNLLTTLNVCSALLFAGTRYSSRGGSITKNGVSATPLQNENKIILTEFFRNECFSSRSSVIDVRPIPEENNWFESVWADYNSRTKL